MNQQHQTETAMHNTCEQSIQTQLKTLLAGNDLWKVNRIEIDQKHLEIHAYVQTTVGEVTPCSLCKRLCSVSILKTNKTYAYLSLFGYRTYIHADEIQMDCPQHEKQLIIPPWDQQINEQLKLSIL